MEFNNKKLVRTSRLINYIIAIVLCSFLIALSGKLIDDVDEWEERPKVEQFQDTVLINTKEAEIEVLEAQIDQKREKQRSIEKTIQIANSNYENAKESFENWLEARKTVGSPKEDKEVLSRANRLDEYYKTEQEWRKELSLINDTIASLNSEKAALKEDIYEEEEKAWELREVEIRKYDLKVFLIRLLFILPILLVAVYFIIKFRKHKYWPIFLGYVLFAFYAFFFGLVPYLPSYGGYIRYTVGIVLIIAFGVYAINRIRAFIEQKKEELKVSTQERAKQVQVETAEKALDNHMCPSCGKDFIVKSWDKTSGKKEKGTFGHVTNFCRYCGLELFKECKSCGTENFAHLPFCSNCGDKVSEK